ncbi:MAG: phospho-N-acetylmuramoyl-pentapeptide-transferase [Defluviitaleaceae bacterium]|nr:phospho-N-acetylmuramoyl-pentapeptide-transferase [Defluviitaleaceae bacterium]
MDLTLLLPIFTAFIIAVIIAPLFIPFLKRLKFGQSIRADGPQSHIKKSGTPTMGGIIFLLSTLITVMIGLLFWENMKLNATLFMLLLPLFGCSLIGFIDDFIIVVKRDNKGLRPKHKMLGLFLIGASFFYLLMASGYPTVVNLGFIRFDLAWAHGIWVLLLILAGSNATNLTDGLDGLLGGCSFIVFGILGMIALRQGDYTIALFCLIMVGSLAGFLVFNLNPAKVFMGDTGSLGLGALMAAVVILLGHDWLLAVVGFIFVIETLSVILQVLYFKKTGGKRLFKMAPLHHHFELSGWGERKVVLVFWLVTLFLGMIAMKIMFLMS